MTNIQDGGRRRRTQNRGGRRSQTRGGRRSQTRGGRTRMQKKGGSFYVVPTGLLMINQYLKARKSRKSRKSQQSQQSQNKTRTHKRK
jgi:hypothetical protein